MDERIVDVKVVEERFVDKIVMDKILCEQENCVNNFYRKAMQLAVFISNFCTIKWKLKYAMS